MFQLLSSYNAQNGGSIANLPFSMSLFLYTGNAIGVIFYSIKDNVLIEFTYTTGTGPTIQKGNFLIWHHKD